MVLSPYNNASVANLGPNDSDEVTIVEKLLSKYCAREFISQSGGIYIYVR
jgi:hypothetical protein